MQEHIKRLRELTEDLPPIPKLIKTISQDKYVEYKTESGYNAAFGIIQELEVAVAKVIFSPNTVLAWHNHEKSREWLIVYDGSITVLFIDGVETKLNIGDYITIDRENIHSVVSKNGARVVAITIPADETFPK